MTHSRRLLLSLCVVGLFGCQKKEAPAPAAAAPAAESSATAKAAPTAVASEPAAHPPAAAAPMAAPVPMPGELPIIAKARAYLGTEDTLNNVRSIHYVGTLVATDPSDPKATTRASIEIIVQKPDQQKVTIKSDRTVETTALNDYDAWTRTTLASDPTKWQQTIQNADGIKRLRANTWENIAFYRGIEREGGSVEDRGQVTKDGIACEKLAFVHAPNIIFYRYFDLNNGRLVFSENEVGGTIRQEGEIVTGGIRLPKTIIQVNQQGNGKEQTVTMTFDKITLNEKFPGSTFAVPSLTNH